MQPPKCVVRIHARDAKEICKQFGKEEELEVVVKKEDQFVPISLTGDMIIAKVFNQYNWRTKRTIHTYYLYGSDKNEITTILSTRCGSRVRGCFIPIPQF